MTLTPDRSSIGRNAGYNLAGAAIPLLLSLLTIPIYLRLVGPDRYGVLAIAWLLLGYFGLFDLGLGKATAYRIAAQRNAPAKDRAITFWTALLISPLLGFVGASILFALASWFFSAAFKVDPSLRQEIAGSVPWLAAAVPITTLTGTLTGTLQARERFFQLNTVSVASTVLFQLAPLAIAYYIGPSLPLLIVAAASARLVAAAWLAFLCYFEISKGIRPEVSVERFRDLLSYGGWVSISSFIGPLLIVSDRFLIGSTLGATAVAHYSIPFQLVQKIQILPASINSAMLPRMSSCEEEERDRLGGIAQSILMAILTPTLCGTILLMDTFLRIWIGDDLGSRIAPLSYIMILAYWVFAISAVKITLIYSAGYPKRVTAAYAIQLPLYLLVLVLAIDRFGLMGCAYALLFRCTVDLLLQSLSYNRRLPSVSVFVNFLFLACAVTLASFPLSATAAVGCAGILIIGNLAFIAATTPRHVTEYARRIFGFVNGAFRS